MSVNITKPRAAHISHESLDEDGTIPCHPESYVSPRFFRLSQASKRTSTEGSPSVRSYTKTLKSITPYLGLMRPVKGFKNLPCIGLFSTTTGGRTNEKGGVKDMAR